LWLARIRPVPKTPMPHQATDYRPISITPVLTCLTERTVVQHYIYPALLSPPPMLQFVDQFPQLLPSSLFHSVINLLSSEPYIIVISLDFSKAFDTVQHSSLLHKLDQLDLRDNIYNWLNDFFDHHSHCTVFHDQQSSLLDITASII